MSATLYALVVLQGTSAGFRARLHQHGAMLSVYRGPSVRCFDMTRGASPGRLFSKPLPVALGRLEDFQMKAPARITSAL